MFLVQPSNASSGPIQMVDCPNGTTRWAGSGAKPSGEQPASGWRAIDRHCDDSLETGKFFSTQYSQGQLVVVVIVIFAVAVAVAVADP